ncbi:GNAT family N-acetyltransferase [Sphingorhabdus buctiana]|uniref:GNAT family N-acetyltransferase n=2 Tax=Sphingorhabdus buctiana TaxID=1508805 RepID=A0ABW4MCZ8_9SPHN
MASLWTEQPELEGRHVLLRPMVRSDGPAIVDAASDGRLWELFYTSVPDADGIETYLDTALAEKGFGRAMPFVVIEKASGKIIGATRYLRMNEDALRLEIGATFYAKRTQRTAINSETKLLLLQHAFEVLNCQCVQIRTDAFNFQSQRAIERLGAKKDGILRNHAYLKGRLRDLVVYSIIANEWEGVKRNLQMRLARG